MSCAMYTGLPVSNYNNTKGNGDTEWEEPHQVRKFCIQTREDTEVIGIVEAKGTAHIKNLCTGSHCVGIRMKVTDLHKVE